MLDCLPGMTDRRKGTGLLPLAFYRWEGKILFEKAFIAIKRRRLAYTRNNWTQDQIEKME